MLWQDVLSMEERYVQEMFGYKEGKGSMSYEREVTLEEFVGGLEGYIVKNVILKRGVGRKGEQARHEVTLVLSDGSGGHDEVVFSFQASAMQAVVREVVARVVKFVDVATPPPPPVE